MDESVRRALARWPNVPAAYGWLALDRRGTWHLEGRPLRHARTIDFIGRNYQADENGAWHFQNGPQRAYVKLAYTPWVLHLRAGRAPVAAGALATHTQQPVMTLRSAWLDEEGSLLLETAAGISVLDDRDLAAMSGALCDRAGRPLDDAALAEGFAAALEGAPHALHLAYADALLPVATLPAAEVAARFGFIADPQPPG
ncbi:MAG TPA: DUF2946 family protein [Gammaproteobacteria bacterium]|nr:DUF2946 family protein [Gammaproteobacteria bacterium]